MARRGPDNFRGSWDEELPDEGVEDVSLDQPLYLPVLLRMLPPKVNNLKSKVNNLSQKSTTRAIPGSNVSCAQGYLAHKKQPPPNILQ